MLFNSFAYAIFLPIVFILYWALPHRFRWVLLLVSSYYFYMSWNAKYVVLILFTTVVSYISARLIEGDSSKSKKKAVLTCALVACLGVLFVFKYFNFAIESVAAVCNLFSLRLTAPTLKLMLPVGISFYTFQTLSYVIDVYRGVVPAEKHFGYYATFVSFFPQLVAGPIERTSNLLPQIKAEHRFDYDQATYGMKLMAWGFFKKIVIADTISVYSGKVFDNPQDYVGFALILAALFFTIQIYCDFSGYSDIAIGTAKLTGIELMTNFKSPYFSSSIREFWRRWHISLSSWFRDYVYIPLGGNRVPGIRKHLNLMITFLVSGLWHGANWTFALWGAAHGITQIIENLLPFNKMNESRVMRVIRILAVFCFCAFAWVFFASKSLTDAHHIISHAFHGISAPIKYLREGQIATGFGLRNAPFLAASLALLGSFDYASQKTDVISLLSNKRPVIRWIIYVLLVLWSILNIPTARSTEFIYFQF